MAIWGIWPIVGRRLSFLTQIRHSALDAHSVRHQHITMTLPFIFCLLATAAFVSAEEGGLPRTLSKLQSQLFRQRSYDSEFPPILNRSDVVDVEFDVAPRQLLAVDPTQGSVSLRAWLRISWKDERLKWESSEFDGIEKTRFSEQDLWTPDIVLLNSVSPTEGDARPQLATLSSDGSISLVKEATLHISCELDISNFPHDEHLCTMTFISWSYNGNEVDLHLALEELDMSDYIVMDANSGWRMAAAGARKQAVVWPCCSEPYPHLRYNFTLSRKGGHSNCGYVAQPILLALLLPLLFALPSLQTSRYVLGTGLVIINLVLMQSVDGGSSTNIAQLYRAVFVLNILALVLSVLVTSISYRSTRGKRPPPTLEKIFVAALGKMCRISGGSASKSDAEGSNWIIIGRVLDRIFGLIFLILVIILLIVLCPRP